MDKKLASLKNLLEISEQYQSRGLKCEKQVNQQLELQHQSIELIQILRKLDSLTQREFGEKPESKQGALLDLFEKESDLIRSDYLGLMKSLNGHLKNITSNRDHVNLAVSKCSNESSSDSTLKIPLKQQELLLGYLKECESNIRNLKSNLDLYEKFNLSLYLNSSNLNSFKLNENKFYDFYQNLQNEIDYFLKFYEKFINC